MTVQTETKQSEQVQQAPKADISNINAQTNNVQETESSKDINWKAFKQAREVERKQSEEIAKQAKKSQEEAIALKAALDAVLSKPERNPRNEHENIENEETEDQRIDKRVNEAIARREAENEKKRREIENQEYPTRLSRDYKDFDQICTTENLDYLDYHYPEIAQAFAYMPQGYDKWSAVYKAVKRFIPNTDSKKDQSKADKNFNKPQSASSPGMTHSSDNAPTHRLDDKRKAENWARMTQRMNKLD